MSWAAGRAERGDRVQPLAHDRAVLREGHDPPVAAVESGDGHLVFWRKCQQELLGGLAGARDPLVPHAAAGVEQDQDPGRQALAAVEMHDLLRAPLVVDPEVLAPQVRDRAAFIIDRRRREHDELAPDGEG